MPQMNRFAVSVPPCGTGTDAPADDQIAKAQTAQHPLAPALPQHPVEPVRCRAGGTEVVA